jgi:hypothetical protein
MTTFEEWWGYWKDIYGSSALDDPSTLDAIERACEAAWKTGYERGYVAGDRHGYWEGARS